MTTTEPLSLTALVAARLTALPEQSPIRAVLQAMLEGHRRNLHRRAAVLKHEDLAALLTKPPLSFSRPANWNGYVPPAELAADEGETLRRIGADGRIRFNQLGHRTCGTWPNDSPQRAVLIAISTEAWEREHQEQPA